jgi:hypothetical protein
MFNFLKLCYAKSECPIGLSSLSQQNATSYYSDKNLNWQVNEELLNNIQPIKKLYSIDQSLYYHQ